MKKLLISFLCIICTVFSVMGLISCDNNKKLTAQEIYEKVSPSVVVVTAESPSVKSSGTGFFYKDGSTIVTNYHVIKDCVTASITLPNGIECEVLTVIGYDKDKDIALLKVDYINGKPLDVRNTEVKTGETVYAIGNSLGFLGGSLSEGIISTAKRELEGQIYIQTTTAVTHGNSGGPLIDSYGKVIGIISAGFGDGLDLNLAIPVETIQTIDISNPKTLQEMLLETISTSHNVLATWFEVEPTALPIDFKALWVDDRFGIKDKNGFYVSYLTENYQQLIDLVYYSEIRTFSIYMRDYTNGCITFVSFQQGSNVCVFNAIDFDQHAIGKTLVFASGTFNMYTFNESTQLICEEYDIENEYFGEGMFWYEFEPIYRNQICESLYFFELVLTENRTGLTLQDIGFKNFL